MSTPPEEMTVNQRKLDELEAANQRQTLIGASVRESLRTDSERYRRSQQMSRTLGVPADVAYRQIDLATQTAKKQELENILQANPGLTACFADPSLAKGIADDVPNLAEIEASLREQRSLGMKFKRAGAALASGTLQLGTGSVYGVPGMILGGLSEYVTAPLARNEWLPADPFAGPADQLLSMASPENGPIGALNEFSNRNAGKYERMVYSGFQSLGMNIPLYAALAITKNPNVILPMFGAATAGEGAGRARREGKSFGQSITFGAEMGAFEVLTEMIPAGKFVEDLANDTGFAKMLFGNVAREQVGEQIATATQDLTEWVHLNPEGTLKDYLEARPEAALSTAVATLVASGGQVSVGYAVDRGMRALTERDQKAQVALRTEEYTKRLIRAAAASKVNSSDPATFEAAVEKIVAEGGGSDSVYIDAKALSEALYQEQVDDLLAGMPEVQAQLKEALATGGDVRIPIQQFAAKLAAKPAMGGLTRHVRFDPDDMSPAEAEQHMKDQTERMSEEVARIVGDEAQAAVFETERKAVEDTIAGDLAKVGRFRPNVGRAYAQYASTWYANMAARVGMTPQAFYDQYQVRIQGEALIGASDLEQRPEPPRFNQRRVQDDAVSVTLVHYSHRGGLKRLDGSWAGTGSAGAERRRFGMGRYGLSEPKGSTKRRLYFYVQKGNEIPQAEEVVTGKNIYRVQADNLYDLDADPRNLKEEAGRNIDYLEELINEQGFDGFITDWTGEQGIKAPVAILFGLSKTVPVESVGDLYQGPKEWVALEPNQDPNEPMNPLTPFVQLEGIKGAQGRLTRALARDADVGGVKNERTVLENETDRFVFGKLTVQDWWDRVRRNLSPDDIRAARKWYGELHDLMTQFFGERDASKMALAWLLSQQNTSPSGGMLNVLRAVDMAMGKPQIKQAGLGQEKLIETLRGQIPKKGYDAKLLDFIDSELKKRTRTVMGNDPRGGQPAVIDVWANRDVGKVDNRVLEYIKNTFGEEAAAGVEVDGEGIAEAQYEWGSKFYQDLIADLNAAAVDGGNWTGFEAQAVGWVAMQRQLGSEAEFPQDLFDKNTYRVSIGLQTGAGTIFAGAGEIQDKATMRVLKTAADLVGVKIRVAEKGLGSYLGDQEGAIQVDVLGSPESLRDFAAVVGHALRQTEVLISRPLKTGKTQGITFRLAGSDTLKNPVDAAALVDLIKAKLQEKIHANEFEAAEENLDSAVNKRAMKAAGIKPAEWKKLTPEERDEKRAGFYRTTNIGDGFQMVSENGVPVIRIFHSTYEVNREAEHELMEKMPEHPVNLRAMRESGTTAEQWAALTPEKRDELRADYYRGRVKWTGNWGSKELEELMNVAEEIKSEETPLELEVSNFDVQFEHNDWETYPDGAGYRDSLLERGREATARDLDAEPGLRLLQDEVRPAGERGPSQVLGRLGEFFQEGVEPVFYSQLIRAVEGLKQEKGSASQWAGIIKNLTQRGVKPEELEWLGVVEWLGEQTGSVTKQEILDYLRANQVEIREVVSSRAYTRADVKRVAIQLLVDDIESGVAAEGSTWESIGASVRKDYEMDAKAHLNSGRTVDIYGNWKDTGTFVPKFTDWTLPGGENNIELLLTLRDRPTQGPQEKKPVRRGRFIGSHYPDVADIVVHIRGNERIDVNGKRTFFIEEDQSDWNLAGRKHGYLPRGAELDTDSDAVPDMPFKESWAMLGMKRVIRWAAENGYDQVAWTTGQQQKDRYDLSKQVDSILVWTTEPEEGETRYFFEAKKDGRVVASDKNSATGLSANELENQLGKDIAGKAVEDLKAGKRAEYTGDDLKIGGEWAVNLYDKYLVNNTNKFIKKYGARVGATQIVTTTDPQMAALAELSADAGRESPNLATVHAFDITDELRAAALAGLPYFQQKRGAFSRSSRTITLLKDADLSTFLHEFGHFQLEVMAEIAARPDAPADIVKDMDTLLAWFGVKDLQTWNAMSLEEQRPHHETFARGIEKYLFTGEAPSTELRSIFGRFRSWMLKVYKSIRNLNVQLTPEVTQVFDRMLASEDAIKAAEATRGFRAIFTTAEEAGMTPEKWLEYQQLGEQSTQDAAEDLERRSLKDMQWLANAKSRELKKLQAKAAALRKKTAEAIRAELLQTPVYAVQEFIKNGTMPEGFALTRAQEKISVELGQLSGKLSLAELKALYGEGEAAPYRYLPRNLVSAEGLPVQPVAELFGFSSVDHMVKAIVEANPIDQEVEGLTDQRMLEEHGELVDPRAVERAAEAAIHNQARMRFVATELSALEKAMAAKAPAGTDRKGRKRTTNATIQAAREYAKVAVARMKIADARRNGKYSAAESRAGREAEKSLKKGNLAEAAMHKRSQILSGFLYRETSKAVEEIERILDYLKKFSSEGTRKGLDQEYLDQIDSLLERMDLRKGVTAAEVAKRKSLAEWVAAQQEAGFEPEIPPELLNEAVRQHYSQMTVEEFRGLRDTVKQIEHLGRLKKKLLTAKDQREFEAIVADIVSSIEANSPGKEVDNRTGNRPIDYAVRLFKGYFASHRKVSSLARQMDGFKDGGKMWEYIVRTMNEAGDRESVMREQATVKLMDLLKPLKAGGAMGGKGLYIQAIGRSLNREARLAVALNVGNGGNKQRLMSGEQWDEGQLQAVLDTLTKEEWDFVQSVWDMFEKDYKPLVAEKERRVGGKEPNWVEPTPVQTRFGEYRGGYYPIKFDPRASQRAAEHADAEAARQEMRAAYTSATTRRSFTKARADEVVDRPLMLSFDGIYQGVNEVIHDLAWHEWLIDVNRLLKNKALASAIRNNYGADVYDQFKRAFRDIARGEQPAQNAFESSLNHIRVGATVTGLGWNVMTSLLQPLGLTQSFVRVGTRWVAKGIGEFMSNPLEATRKVYEKSEFMRIRGKTLNREINEVRNVVAEKSAARNAIEQSFFFLIQKAQLGADIPTWLGAYEKAQAEGNDEARSVALADQAVLDSQSGGQVKDLATIQRGSPALKLFTNFISYFNLTYNLAAESYHRTDFKKPADVLALGVDYLMLLVLPSVLGTLLREAVTGGDDDDDELVKKLIADQIGYLLGLFVGVREATTAVQMAAGVSPYAMGYSGPAGTRFFAELSKFGQQINQGELDMALVKSAVNVAGVALHLPAAQINRTMTGVVALIEGDTTDPRVLLSGYRKQ